MADSQNDKLFRAEYAKSGQASCKKCKEKIAKESLRMAIVVQVAAVQETFEGGIILTDLIYLPSSLSKCIKPNIYF